MREDLLSTRKTVFFPDEIFASLTTLAESHTDHRNSCPHNKEMGNLMQLLSEAIVSALVFGQACLLSQGCPGWHSDLSRWCFYWVGCWNLWSPGRSLSPTEDRTKKGKRRPLDSFFVFYVMIILSLLEENDTLTSWFRKQSYLWICSACLTTDCDMHGTYHFVHCYFKAVSPFYRYPLTRLPKLKVLNMFLQMD